MPEWALAGQEATRLPATSPASTYRLQLHAGFGFARVAALGDYLAALGVTHVYLSPILQAAPGSPHGYDVIDHSRLSADLGGEAGFRAMAETLRGHGLGVVVDVVPNHMAIPAPESLNRQLWSVLAQGQGSPYAHWFDVDWAALSGRMLLPILGAPVADCLDDLAVTAPDAAAAGVPDAADGPVLRYFDHALPIREGTADLPLDELLAAQHYRLAYWRDAATGLNWRRFFDITSLIGVRVEDPDVFAATHRLLLELMAEGLIDGLRVDHPDGLADPRGYLRRLAQATDGGWVVAEKILTGAEELPPDWPCAGTTGYDALNVVGGVFTDQAGEPAMTRAYHGFTGSTARFAEVAEVAKRQVTRQAFGSEVARLARLAAPLLSGALAGVSDTDLRTVLSELVIGFGVYRAYVVPGEPPGEVAAAAVDAAADAARALLPPPLHAALAAIRDLVLGLPPGGGNDGGPRGAPPDGEGHAAFIVAFQQVCGPVMAKGVEDTAFYRWSRLVSLNEVGGEPARFGAGPEEFHGFCLRLALDWPATMTTLSTHDTKRQEDVRARLAVLAELPADWAREVAGWHERAAALAGGWAPEPDTEYLLWQTLVGAWPVSQERAIEYLRKAMREAKTVTSWTDPAPACEREACDFAAAVLADETLTGQITAFADRLALFARANSLGAKLVQLTMPGVADVYQGCELAGLSLVDPDNRRPVDFALRRELLAACDRGAPAPAGAGDAEGLSAEKLLVSSAALRLRRAHPDWFTGAYQPLPADGPAARHVLAFVRGGEAVTVATRLPAGLAAAGGWAGTALPLPGDRWRDLLSGAIHTGPRPLMTDLAKRFPVALLAPEPPVGTGEGVPGGPAR